MNDSLYNMNGMISFNKTDDIISDLKYIIDASSKTRLSSN